MKQIIFVYSFRDYSQLSFNSTLSFQVFNIIGE